MLFRPLLAEAASATLEPRHVVVPLRMMCPRSELVVGAATALDEDARTVVCRVARRTVRGALRAVRARARLDRAHAPRPGARRARARLQRPRRRDRASQPRARGARSRRPRARNTASLASSSSARATPASRRSPSSTTSCATHSASIRGSEPHRTLLLIEASDRILHELSPRLAAYVSKLLAAPSGSRYEPSTTARAARRGVGDALRRRADRDPHAVWTARCRAHPLLSSLGLAGRRTAGPGQGRRAAAGRGRDAASGRRRLRPCRQRYYRARRTLPTAGTPSARRGSSPGTSGASRGLRLPDDRPGRRARPVRTCWRRSSASLHRLLRLFATRSYHLYQLPLFTRKLRVITDWTVAMFCRRDMAQNSARSDIRSASIESSSGSGDASWPVSYPKIGASVRRALRRGARARAPPASTRPRARPSQPSAAVRRCRVFSTPSNRSPYSSIRRRTTSIVKRVGSSSLVHFLPAKRRRDGRTPARAHCVDRRDRLPLTVLVGVDQRRRVASTSSTPSWRAHGATVRSPLRRLGEAARVLERVADARSGTRTCMPSALEVFGKPTSPNASSASLTSSATCATSPNSDVGRRVEVEEDEVGSLRACRRASTTRSGRCSPCSPSRAARTRRSRPGS